MRLEKTFLSVLLALCGTVSAADLMNPDDMPRYGSWHSSMIGGGGYLQNVVFTSNSKCLYTYVDVGGFYRSDDAGRHWQMLHGNLPNQDGKTEIRGLIADPRNPDRIVVACGTQWADHSMGIFISDDAGRTLHQTLTARFCGNADFRWDGFILCRDPQNPDHLLAGSFTDGLYRSTDNGHTWSLCGDATKGFIFTDVRFDQTNPQRAWACALAWQGYLGGKSIKVPSAFFRSDDGGVTWQKLADDSPRELIQDPKLPRIYGPFAGATEIRASDDGGTTWKLLSDGLPIDPAKARGNNASPHRFNAFAAGLDFILIGSTAGTVYRMPSGGTHWEQIDRLGIEYRGWYGGERNAFGQAMASLSIDPHNPDHWFTTDWYAIYETIDAGQHWTLSMDGVEDTVIHNLCQDPADPGRVHLGMADDGYFLSTDGGRSFQPHHAAANVKDVALSPSLPARIYAVGAAGGEWISNQVYVSIDGGTKWQRSPMAGLPDINKSHCNTIAVNPDDPYDVYLAVSGPVTPNVGGPYHSTDGGKTWTWVGQGLPQNAQFYSADIWAPGRKLAIGPASHLLTISSDSGIFTFDPAAHQWHNLPSDIRGPITVSPDPFIPAHFLVSSDNGIWSVDTSRPQVTRHLPTRATYLAADLVVKGRFAASVNDGVLLSTDSGATWSLLDKALPHPLATNPLCFAGDRLVAGSGGSGTFWIPLPPAADHPIHAKPVTPAVPPNAQGKLPTLQLDFSRGTDIPDGWDTPWAGTGQVSAHLDTQVTHDGKPSLRLQCDTGSSYGSISQPFSATAPFTLRGFGKAEGTLEECQLAIQVFDAQGKQAAWQTIANLRRTRDWTTFSTDIQLPASAKTYNLVLTIRGTGAAWINDLSALPTPSVFKE